MDSRRKGYAGEMKKYAVIGKPLGHSLSPAMHNAAFKELGADAMYEALELGDIAAAYESLAREYCGLNVTIPYKTAIIDLLDEKEMAAELAGAVNCISFDGGMGIGYNTDIVGAVDALKSECPDLKGKKVLILGAGGAARAIACGCAIERAEISIYNRSKENAHKLAGELSEKLDARIRASDEISLEGVDILVNATPAGMHPNEDETPLTSTLALSENMVVMDIVYNPLETKFLKEAREAGAKTISGLEMFIGQGAESLRIWGYEPPLEVMRKAVLKELKQAK